MDNGAIARLTRDFESSGLQLRNDRMFLLRGRCVIRIELRRSQIMVRNAGYAIVGNELLELRLMIVAKNDRNVYRCRRGAPSDVRICKLTVGFRNRDLRRNGCVPRSRLRAGSAGIRNRVGNR